MKLGFVVKICTSLWIRLITQLGELISSLEEKQRSCVFCISTLTTTLEMTTFMKQNRWRCDTRVHVIIPIVGPHSLQCTCTSKAARRLHSCYTTKVWCAQLWEPLLINKWHHWGGEGGLGPTKPQTLTLPYKNKHTTTSKLPWNPQPACEGERGRNPRGSRGNRIVLYIGGPLYLAHVKANCSRAWESIYHELWRIGSITKVSSLYHRTPKSSDMFELQLTHTHQGLSMLLGARIAYKLMISPNGSNFKSWVGDGEVGTWHPKYSFQIARDIFVPWLYESFMSAGN